MTEGNRLSRTGRVSFFTAPQTGFAQLVEPTPLWGAQITPARRRRIRISGNGRLKALVPRKRRLKVLRFHKQGQGMI